MMWSRLALFASFTGTLAFLDGCASCGHVQHIDLSSVPQAQLSADRAIFDKTTKTNQPERVLFALGQLAMHPREASVFVSLGLVTRDGKQLALSATGAALARRLRDGRYAFHLDVPPKAIPARFMWATEEDICDEGSLKERTYRWSKPVGTLTTLGNALYAAGSLYRGNWSAGYEERPYPWKKTQPPLQETFGLFPDAPYPASPVDSGGEAIEFPWSQDFAGVGA